MILQPVLAPEIANLSALGFLLGIVAKDPLHPHGGEDFEFVVPAGTILNSADRIKWVNTTVWPEWTLYSQTQRQALVDIPLKDRASQYSWFYYIDPSDFPMLVQ